MFELRWLEYKQMQFDDVGSPIRYKLKTKLQYREMINLLEIGFHEPIWSKWQDVPKERDCLLYTSPSPRDS